MQYKSLKYIFLMLFVFMIGCSSSNNKNEKVPSPKPALSPGSCLIIGEIVHIDNTRFSNDNKSPCSHNPCWATVKIDSVIGCGAGAPAIGKNDLLDVNFTFTLAETNKDLFPNLEESMPGLSLHSIFKASIKKRNAFNSKNNTEYQINTYKRLSNK